MTGPGHYREAENCARAGCAADEMGAQADAMTWFALGQIHATLALAEAYVAGAVMRPEDRDEWDRATGRLAVGNLPDDGPDPDRPETWAFGEAPAQPLRPDEAGGCVCPETSDGQHCGDWHEGGKCGACGQTGPDPDEDQADQPEPAPYDPGPEVDDEGGMSEYRYVMPEDYERGQS